MLSEILGVCRTIKSERNVWSVHRHLMGEVSELDNEMYNKFTGDPMGIDGILGESVDVILCAVDLIYQEYPDITEEQVMEVVHRKLNKWVSLYGN